VAGIADLLQGPRLLRPEGPCGIVGEYLIATGQVFLERLERPAGFGNPVSRGEQEYRAGDISI